ncbi:MAG: carbohydrate ABC transporter permease [Anaerolineae bacterium]|nr:carbohydrate ABC transporter permease [Anaerolineae bacterium]
MIKGRTLRAASTHLILIIGAFITLIPVMWVWMSAFKTDSEIRLSALSLPVSLNFTNFSEAWTRGRFNIYMGNSVIVSALTVLLVISTASLAGYAFARYKFRGNGLLFYLVFLGMTIPVSAKVGPLLSLMYAIKLVDTHLGLVLAYAANSIPFSVLMMRAFYRGFASELEDAARIDGANGFQMYLRIFLPLSLPALTALGVFTLLSAWNEFQLAFLLVNRDATRTLPLGLITFQGSVEEASQYALSMAGIVISALPVIIVYLFFQKQFIRGITSGSVK